MPTGFVGQYPQPYNTPVRQLPQDTPHQTTLSFLDTIYGTQSGYCCIGYISGDPNPQCKNKPRFEWYSWPRQRDTVSQRLTQLTEQGMETHSDGINIYAARCLFSKRERKYTYALPSPWIWLDDVKSTDAKCTMLVETSTGNYQAWIRLDTPINAEEARELQRRWRDSVGADSCSGDAIHMVRVPGGINTKRHGRFRVRIEKDTGTTYPLEIIKSSNNQSHCSKNQTENNTTLDIDGLFNQESITRIRRELDTPNTSLLKQVVSSVPYIQRIPARIKPGTQTYNLLTDADSRSSFVNKGGGSWDASLVRYIVCKGLVFVGYDANHIAAFLDYLEDPDTQRIKGIANLVGDVKRLFTADKLGPLYAQKQRQRKQHREHTHSSVASLRNHNTTKGRKEYRRVTPADVLAHWREKTGGDRCIYNRKEVAEELRISLPTLDRHIRRLKQIGAITTEIPLHRQFSIVILNDIEMSTIEPVSSTVTTKSTAILDPELAVLGAIIGAEKAVIGNRNGVHSISLEVRRLPHRDDGPLKPDTCISNIYIDHDSQGTPPFGYYLWQRWCHAHTD